MAKVGIGVTDTAHQPFGTLDDRARSINPATGTWIEDFADDTPAQVEAKLERSQDVNRAWRQTPLQARAQLIARLGDQLRAKTDIYASFMTREMGKPIREARAEIEKCATHCLWYAQHGPAMLADQPTTVEGGRAVIAMRPIGSVLGIMPWNFPFWQVLRAAVPIVLAGNTYVLKHARNVMRSAYSLEEAFDECGFPKGVFSLLNIRQDNVADVLADPRVAAVTVTGSARAGAAIAAQAGAHLKKSVLELGGSDPFIVLEGADLERAAVAAVKARFQNTGQVCIAAKRLILEASIAEAFLERFVAETKKLSVGDPSRPETDIGPMARPDLREELHRQVQSSIAAGAALVLGGQPVSGAGNFYEPTILTNVRPGMAVFDEETFGPCAAVCVASDADDAIALANDSRYGLSASLWSTDSTAATAFAERLDVGGVFLNGYPTSDSRVPIGGVKQSGYGRELCHYGVTEFVNVQTVWRDRP